MTLNSKTRKIWAEKIIDLANLAAGALIFDQFVSEKNFSVAMVIAGIFIVITGYFISFTLLRKNWYSGQDMNSNEGNIIFFIIGIIIIMIGIGAFALWDEHNSHKHRSSKPTRTHKTFKTT